MPQFTRPSSNAPLVATALVVSIAMIAAVYLPDIGRGFVKDDFGWIQDGRAARADPAAAFRPHTAGFYRPLVTASFACDYNRYGLNARLYGFTNLALYLLCIAALWLLLREAGVSAAAAAVGAFAWALNPHGINMAVVWLSGRTSLLLTLGSALSAVAFLRRWRIAGAVLLFGALLSKEEATLLPFILAAWLLILREGGPRARLLDVAAVGAPLVAYVALRVATTAMTPWTAPSFYAPTTDVHVLAANAVEYLDRAATFPAVITIAAMVAYRSTAATAVRRRLLLAGAVWFTGALALTVWLPVRSSLYAVFPSVGSALICAAAVDGLRDSRATPQRDLRLAAVLVSVLCFIPVYQSRNDRWVEPARLSARTMRAVASDPPEGSTWLVVLEDEPRPYASFADAFGAFASEAVSEVAQRPMHAKIVAGGAVSPEPGAARYKLTGGRVDHIR